MKKPGILLSLVPVVLLMAILAIGVFIFGDDVASGPSQIALTTAAVATCIIGTTYLKIPWSKFEEGIGENIKNTSSALYILLMIGALTSTWMLSGVVPTMIYYGLEIIHPKVFILVSFLLCTLVSVLAGSSWTTVGTIGVAMFSAGQIIGIPVGWLSGAIISGAYLGDKVSPLSDTTNLSASMAGTDLYRHVRYNLGTTVPAMLICIIVYTVVGFNIPTHSQVDVTSQLNALNGTFNISPWLLLIPCATIFMIVKKVPAIITLFLSALVGALTTFWAQPQIITQFCDSVSGFHDFCYSVLKMMSSSITISTGDPLIDSLASTDGMFGMVNTVWLILCIIILGGSLCASGMIDTITEKLMSFIKGRTSLSITTIVTCFFCNIVLADQYMAIVLPGKMFSDVYRKMGYAPEFLSRTLQDSATVSSVLVPWNTCALVQAGVLGVATFTYLPYSIFCLITPLISVAIAASGYRIARLPQDEDGQVATQTA